MKAKKTRSKTSSKRPTKKRAAKKTAKRTKKNPTKRTAKKTAKRTAKKTPAKRTAKKTKKRTAKKANPTKKTATRKTPKRKTAKRKRRSNPRSQVDAVSFKIAGRTPMPDRVAAAMPLVLRELATYEPIQVTDKRSFFPWLARRMNALDVCDLVLIHALTELAERGKVRLFVDDDRRKVMARADLAICPTMGDAAEPLIWVSL